MPNTSTVNPAAANAVDEAVRIAGEGSRRSTESAQAALQASRRYFDQAAQINRELFALWTDTAEAGLRSAFEVQNALLASGQSLLDSSASISKDAFGRWAAMTRQAQTAALKSYKESAKFLEGLTTE